MIKSEIEKRSSLIAAICYTIFAVYNVIIRIRIIVGLKYCDTALIIIYCIYWIAVLGMAVTLFTKNKKAIVAAAGVNACYQAYFVIKYLNVGSWRNSDLLYTFCFFVAYAGVAALIILSLKGNAIVKKSWFIPAAAMLLGYLLGYVVPWIRYGYVYFSTAWVRMLFSIIEIAALLFVGMWIKEDTIPAQTAPVNEYATFDLQAIYSAPASTSAFGGADKLKMYKELLESGIITQEEFDAKKKQILGL